MAIPSNTNWQAFGGLLRSSSADPESPPPIAFEWVPESGSGPPLALTLSESSEAETSFRGHVGARYAVQAANSVLGDFYRDHHLADDITEVEAMAKETLPQQLVQLWSEAAYWHAQKYPFMDDELEEFESHGDTDLIRQLARNPLMAYGAGMILGLFADSFILVGQLGNGAIHIAPDLETTALQPVPPGARSLIGGAVQLHLPNAWRYFRFGLIPISGNQGDVPRSLLFSSQKCPPVSASTTEWHPAAVRLLRAADNTRIIPGPEIVMDSIAQLRQSVTDNAGLVVVAVRDRSCLGSG